MLYKKVWKVVVEERIVTNDHIGTRKTESIYFSKSDALKALATREVDDSEYDVMMKELIEDKIRIL